MDIFDQLIFDEASQIFVENGITLIYRSKKIAIIGDHKQLQPTNFFMKEIGLERSEENEIDIDLEIEEERTKEIISLLDFGK
jgi:superfamily I DNA and/or RNA helicase